MLAHAAGMTSLQRMVPDSSAGFGEASLRQAAAQGSTVNFGGVGVGSGGEAVPCWALDDFALVNVSLLKIDAVRALAAERCALTSSKRPLNGNYEGRTRTLGSRLITRLEFQQNSYPHMRRSL